jgi:hypothetical protein
MAAHEAARDEESLPIQTRPTSTKITREDKEHGAPRLARHGATGGIGGEHEANAPPNGGSTAPDLLRFKGDGSNPSGWLDRSRPVRVRLSNSRTRSSAGPSARTVEVHVYVAAVVTRRFGTVTRAPAGRRRRG